jgi:hypothetical protein
MSDDATPSRWAKPKGVVDWFWNWIAFHQSINRHKDWVTVEDANAVIYYQGWIDEFEVIHLDEKTAEAISRQIQVSKTRIYPDNTVAEVRERYFERKRVERAKLGATSRDNLSGEELIHSDKSFGCPECQNAITRLPSGFAIRRFKLNNDFPLCLNVALFCRCAYGRWRSNRHVNRFTNIVDYHDLQMIVELWDGTKDHATFDFRDPPASLAQSSRTEFGRYLTPRECDEYEHSQRNADERRKRLASSVVIPLEDHEITP